MSSRWDTPYTAEELAAMPKPVPFIELLEEYAERTGQRVIPVTWVTASSISQRGNTGRSRQDRERKPR